MNPPPRMGMRFNPDFIRAMGKKSDDFIIILDVDRLFSSEELSLSPTGEANELPSGPQNAGEDAALPAHHGLEAVSD